MQKTLVLCHSAKEYKLIAAQFLDNPVYEVVQLPQDFSTFVRKNVYTEMVLFVKDKNEMELVRKNLRAIDDQCDIYDAYEGCQEDNDECMERNFEFVMNWLKNIHWLRSLKADILDEIMKRGF